MIELFAIVDYNIVKSRFTHIVNEKKKKDR